jgi:hypothetical protein
VTGRRNGVRTMRIYLLMSTANQVHSTPPRLFWKSGEKSPCNLI